MKCMLYHGQVISTGVLVLPVELKVACFSVHASCQIGFSTPNFSPLSNLKQNM